MSRQCFEHSEHLKSCISYLQARTPAAGQPYRKPCVAAPACLSSPLELGRAPSATEQAPSLHRPSEDGRPTAQPCTRARLPETREQSLHRREGRQRGAPRDVFTLTDGSQQRELRLLLIISCLLPRLQRTGALRDARPSQETHNLPERRKQQALPTGSALRLPPPPTRGVRTSVCAAHPFSKHLVFPKVFRVQRKGGGGA
ncbi:unnamed protein product [Rangifer tarandus platyrhynchus]|uniref:Uncharacterized protein n=2 Tax=Rangifer tarandus platyrhynchus TaxID=3082113 RepID=A0ACB0FGD6_RANTA|nr:unnamed protein product [Rangifer tarandus platyrhynchus]CAI9712135.1 unnamed protein product [Rangifer tarandus platyrhynchus]